MFGRNLIEQVRSEEHISDRAIPIIVEKCIEAVEALGAFSQDGNFSSMF